MSEMKKLTVLVSEETLKRLKSYCTVMAISGNCSIGDAFLAKFVDHLKDGKEEWDLKLKEGSDV
jgi:hypothetical protein